jgi:hypothetical protein
MAQKLTIKLVSNSGELLNVVSCYAGQVAVLRAATPADIRPYQRALFGSSGPERFSILVDDNEYVPTDHNLIGFGEPSPHAGLTVGEYLSTAGALDGSIDGLLLTIGLQGLASSPCETLTPDQERRLRLAAATCNPSKILILNEPFEPIASGWRERFADLLLSSARTHGCIVVVTHTSYRPEAWIDNDAVTRIQVGQSSQRTVGFRARSSTTTRLLQQLRQLVGNDFEMGKLLGTDDTASSKSSSPAPAIGALGAATTIGAALSSTLNAGPTPVASAPQSPVGFAVSNKIASLMNLKTLAITASAIGVSATVLFVAFSPPLQQQETELKVVSPPTSQVVAPVQPEHVTASTTRQSSKTTIEPVKNGEIALAPLNEAPKSEPQPKRVVMVLDEYPELISTALKEASRGILDSGNRDSGATVSSISNDLKKPLREKAGGNLFRLLEQASATEGSKSQNGPGSPSNVGSSNPNPNPAYYGNGSEEQFDEQSIEQRREEIRKKFLESLNRER